MALRSSAPARAGWGCALLLAPDRLLGVDGRSAVTRRAITVARVLGARQVAQAVVTAARPTSSVAAVSAVVDALHASSCLALAAAFPRWRRLALIDAAVGVALTAAALAATRSSPPPPRRDRSGERPR